MPNLGDYDPNEEIPYLPSVLMYQMLSDVTENIDLYNVATPAGVDPSNHSSSNSSPQSTGLQNVFSSDEIQVYLDENSLAWMTHVDDLGTTLSQSDLEDMLTSHEQGVSSTYPDVIGGYLFTEEDDKLQLIAQPKAVHRERYPSEIDPIKHRAQRFIRTDEDNKNYEYPTVQIPAKWRDARRSLYVRVALVTVTSDNVPHHCIHPYVIDSPEKEVIKDPEQNSLYFRINNDECISGEKSFHISRQKKIQTELRSHGPMRLLNSNDYDVQRVRNPHDAKQIIATYQLWKSQLVFTLAERVDQQEFPTVILSTSVASQIMVDEASRRSNRALNNRIDDNFNKIKCIPKKSAWAGGDEIVLILPNQIKHKVYEISIDFGSSGEVVVQDQTQVDTKTILFRTPTCPKLHSDENIKVSVVIRCDQATTAFIDFQYLTPRNPSCHNCQLIKANYNMTNKRRSHLLVDCVTDGGEYLVKERNRLSLGETSVQAARRISPSISTNEKDLKFEKYLNQLKEAVAEFVRTDDPSHLFRRTRVLLSKCDDDNESPPLHDAIQHGHVQLARTLIKQVFDMPSGQGLLDKQNCDGQTPLLLAAKFNQWEIMEMLLEKRSDLVQHTDKSKNNFLHLLAENQSTKTIEHSLAMLSDDVQRKLLNGKNQANQRPVDIAQLQNNTQCTDLLHRLIDLG